MKRFHMFIKEEPLVLPVVLIIIGLLGGFVTSKIFYSLLPDVIIDWNQYYIQSMAELDYDGMQLLTRVFMNFAKEVLIFFLLCITILGIPYYCYVILRKSFNVSFLVSTFVYVYGSKGVFLAFCNYFPQMILYVPAMYLCIKHGYSMYVDVQNGIVKPNFKNNLLIKKYGKKIMMILGLFLIGALLEAFVGNIIWFWGIDVLQK